MSLPSFHGCPAPRCKAKVPRHRLACRKHWFQLPADLRDAIWQAWRAEELGLHALLIARARHLWGASAAVRVKLIAAGTYMPGSEVE